jgi:hypothetical protein
LYVDKLNKRNTFKDLKYYISDAIMKGTTVTKYDLKTN